MFMEAVLVCEAWNVQIHAVVADGASTNRNFFSIIHGAVSAPNYQNFHAPHPTRPDEPILICSDTSHLLKVISGLLTMTHIYLRVDLKSVFPDSKKFIICIEARRHKIHVQRWSGHSVDPCQRAVQK